MNTKKTNLPVLILMSLLIMSSCTSIKQIAYFQPTGTSNNGLQPNDTLFGLYDVRIKPKDMLSITVVTSEPLTSRMYNLIVPSIYDPSNYNSYNAIMSQPALQSYLVDNEGNIDFPLLGKIAVLGLTPRELEETLQQKMASAFSKERPVITIRIINYVVNVLGEVNRPGKYSTSNEKMTIFEALAQAGDLTIYGRRDNVKVLRENYDGSKKYFTIDLNDQNIIHSPVYYLEQNDVVYVEPNGTKARSAGFGAAESFGISALSILISMTSLLVTIFKK
jgi:polysaccharide export outer membrane protein